jgi:hypothetical protein
MNNENLTVHIKVKDFSAWRTSYNRHEKDRASAGITNGRVFRRKDYHVIRIFGAPAGSGGRGFHLPGRPRKNTRMSPMCHS